MVWKHEKTVTPPPFCIPQLMTWDQRWIGCIDWWRWPVKSQLARNIDQWLAPRVWQLKSEAPCFLKEGFSTRSQVASRTPHSNHHSSRSRITTFSVSIWYPDVLVCSKIAESAWYSEVGLFVSRATRKECWWSSQVSDHISCGTTQPRVRLGGGKSHR